MVAQPRPCSGRRAPPLKASTVRHLMTPQRPPERWREQWGRVRRFHGRVRHLASGKPAPVDQQAELDDTYSFFLHCYHLKDWLAHDETFQRSRDEIEDFVSRTPALALCGDIANSVKHLKLVRPPKSGEAPGEIDATFKIEMAETFAFDGVEKPFERAAIYIKHKGGLVAIVRVADQAYYAWQGFIRDADT